MKEKDLFRLYVIGVYSAIASFGYLAFMNLLRMSWLFLLAIVGLVIVCVWHNRLLDAEQVRHLQAITDAPETPDEVRDYCRSAIEEVTRNRERWTFEYWKTQWNLLRQEIREARSTPQMFPRGEDPIKRDARAWGCSRQVAEKLHHLEKHVNEMVITNIIGRVGELESRERWRTAKEWFALRDTWHKLANDPITAADLRAFCARCLEDYPQTPPIGPRYFA